MGFIYRMCVIKILYDNKLFSIKTENYGTKYSKKSNIIIATNKTENINSNENLNVTELNKKKLSYGYTTDENKTNLANLRGYNSPEKSDNWLSVTYDEILLIEWPSIRTVLEQT